MKLKYAWGALGAVALAIVMVAAYQMGRQQPVSPAALAATEPTAEPLPASTVSLFPDAAETAPADAPPPRFSHFRVGNRNVKSLYAGDRYVWVGTSGGVIRYDTSRDDYELFNNTNSSLLSNGIFHISELQGRMAIGTYGGGLSLLDPQTNQWQNFNIPQGLADQFVYDVLTASNGDVWIATWSGANRVHGGELDNPDAWETFTVENTAGGLPNPWVYGVAEGADGEIWLATEAGLARYDGGEWTNWRHEDGLGAPFELVRDAIQFKNDPARASQHHAQQKSEQGLGDVDVAYNPNYVISLAVQSDGVVWCGTWGGGLARFDGQQWRNYTTADGLPANHIFMLHVDESDRLWIGTNQGLAYFRDEGEGFVVRTVADGLYADNVFSIANGADGSVWIGSFGGVARLETAWR